jgi:hypothetical protein
MTYLARMIVYLLNSDMDWMKTFPYKWQLADITFGFSALSCGAIFWLISVGMTSPLWIIMAVTSLSIGVACTLTGSIWCCIAIRRSRLDVDLCGHARECEAETLTSEATEMIR